MSLKVTKSATRNPVEVKKGNGVLLESSGPSEFGKLGLDMETSVEEDRQHTLNGTTDADDQSIARTSKPTTDGSSKTPGQDAQKIIPRPAVSHLPEQDCCGTAGRVDGRHVVEDESCGYRETEDGENFDLSAAMNEVGSFLQSWDTDRDVRELKKDNVRPVKPGLRMSGLRNRSD